MKNTLLLFFLFSISFSINAQNERPKLVVGIVVDQMRADYLDKFWDNYGEEGFKRMVNEGYNCRSTFFDYVPTNTGPGHASIFTGAYPSIHGVVDNDSYDRYLKQEYYCASDPSNEGVGGQGNMSPIRMQTTTIGDEINLYQNFKSKSIGFSLKDRGAIFPAGHSGQAYWLT
ncbi:MAG: alkaline phosphatase family protein, partial [Flavobacteriales bacterium]|nr:alkaline phosphatase family protein [Flavobacteriales bacterium]